MSALNVLALIAIFAGLMTVPISVIMIFYMEYRDYKKELRKKKSLHTTHTQ